MPAISPGALLPPTVRGKRPGDGISHRPPLHKTLRTGRDPSGKPLSWKGALRLSRELAKNGSVQRQDDCALADMIRRELKLLPNPRWVDAARTLLRDPDLSRLAEAHRQANPTLAESRTPFEVTLLHVLQPLLPEPGDSPSPVLAGLCERARMPGTSLADLHGYLLAEAGQDLPLAELYGQEAAVMAWLRDRDGADLTTECLPWALRLSES